MKININRKYALFFGISSVAIMLILVAAFAFIVVKKGAELRKNVKDTDAVFFRESHGKTLFNTAQYLGQHLFIPVYQTDIGAVNRLINDMRLGLPFISFVVADAKGMVLTDGTRQNRLFGTRLDVNLAQLKKQPIIAENTVLGQRISFTIRSKRHVAGYGQIIYSNEPLIAAIERLHSIFDSGWTEFRTVFLRISLIGIAASLATGALLSFLFSGTISRPLILLKQAANRVAQGDLDCRVEIDTHDEIGELAASFNQMVADMKRSTEELREANRKLTQLDRVKSELVSIVSHELRTPVTSIKAFTELILMKPNMEPDRQRKMLTTIKDESDRLSRLINDTLDLTKIEEGRGNWRITSVTAEEIIHRAVDCIKAHADNKSINLTIRLEPSLPSFEGDKDRLIQVVTNILSNAVKFTPTSGAIEINAFLEKGPEPRISVTVADTGRGIPAEHLQRIFEKFYRVDDALTSSTGDGIGLGLTIASSIVDYHGGRIWAESRPGAGSRFTFTLPLRGAGSKADAAG